MTRNKGFRYFMTAVLSAVFLAGCNKNTTDENISTSVNNNEKEEDLFGKDNNLPDSMSGSFSFKNGLLLENQDNIVKTTFHFEMKPAGWDMGVLMFADGYLQPFSLGEEKETAFPIVKVESEMDRDIEFELVSGIEGETVRIDALSLLHPELEVKKEMITAGLSFSTSSPLPASTVCSKTVLHEEGSKQYEYRELPQDIKDMKIITEDDGTVVNQLQTSSWMDFYQDGKKAKWIEIKDGVLSCELYVCGGIYEENNIYLFLDNKLVYAFDGKEFCTVNVNAEQATVVKIQADISDMDIKEYTQMFAVKVPSGKYMDDDIYMGRSNIAFIHNQKE